MWGAQALRVCVLGDFQVLHKGRAVAARTRQMARLGALLAASPGTPVNRDRIIEVLWADKPPQTAVNTIQVHISQLRTLVGSDLINTTSQGYVLQVEPAAVDAEWFREQVLDSLDESTNGQRDAVRERLQVALDMWRGEPYEDLRDSFIESRRSELRELRERAIEVYLDACLATADTPRKIGEIVASARGQVARQPLRERGHEVLIRALLAEDNRAEASRAYRRAVEVFADQAGVSPSPRLRRAIQDALK